MPSRTGIAVICAAVALFALRGVLSTTADAAITVNAGLSGALTDDAILRIGRDFAPTGTVLSLVIDARSGVITDYGLGGLRPDLSSLGDPTSLVR